MTTGTSPYTYQWFEKAPSGNYVKAGSNFASFSFVTSNATATGSWDFILQVTDNAGSAVNSTAVSVTVNAASLNQFVFSPMGTQTAGTSFSITITAENAYGNTITNYTGTNTLTVSTGTISPTSTGAFTNGVWTGKVTLTGTGSDVTISTSGSGMSGTSGNFTVDHSALNHFTFSTISSPQIAAYDITLTITAEDAYGNTITSYTGTPSLTCSAGSISPDVMTAFVDGVGVTTVTVPSAGLDVTITATDGTHTGTSNSFTLNPTISASAGDNGAISPSGTFAVDYGANQTFTITPDAGYYVDNVFVNGLSVGAVSSYTLTNIQDSQNIYAAFTSTPSSTATPTPTPTPTPTSAPTATLNPTPISTPSPTATPLPPLSPTPNPSVSPAPTTESSPTPTLTTPSPSQNSLTTSTQTQSIVPQEIFGVAAAAVLAVVFAIMFVFRNKIKFDTDDETDFPTYIPDETPE